MERNVRLKELRKKSKLTQAQIAEYLNVDQSLVTKLENGTRNLNSEVIEKLCDLYGCSSKYLVGEDNEFIPLNFAFRSNGINSEDLDAIANINRIVMNIRFMKKKEGEIE